MAYSAAVKQLVLNVDDVPVVSETAARQMARGAARLFHSDLAVAVTGVGGPDGQNGDPPGTVWYALVSHQKERAELNHFESDPKTVCESACREVLAVLHDSLNSTDLGLRQPDRSIRLRRATRPQSQTRCVSCDARSPCLRFHCQTLV